MPTLPPLDLVTTLAAACIVAPAVVCSLVAVAQWVARRFR